MVLQLLLGGPAYRGRTEDGDTAMHMHVFAQGPIRTMPLMRAPEHELAALERSRPQDTSSQCRRVRRSVEGLRADLL
eukprot:2079696-Heterocapsa_arctica.AAC.1